MKTGFRPFAACRLPALAILLAAAAAYGAQAGESQDREDFFGSYTHRIEGVTVGVGDAGASNAAAQIINPWPAYARDRRILSESQRMIGAIKRYQANSGAKPLPASKVISAGPAAQADPSTNQDTQNPPASNGPTGE